MKYQVAHHSIVGTRRSNQDRVGYAERDNAVLLVLADGLGGHAGGALAAEILLHVSLRAFKAVRAPLISKPSAFLALTIMQAHQAMQAIGKKQRPPIQPRTTCVLCLVQNGYAYWAHVGDSRLYHFRNGRLLTRTRDDTSVELLHEGGVLSEEEMLSHPNKSSLLKCLGSATRPSISLGAETALYRDDTLLLCSDGLWEAFAPEELVRYLENPSLEEAVQQMLFDAEDKMRKSCDNTSAVGLRWEAGVTSSLPLQKDHAAHADQQTLLDGAARQTARAKTREQRNAASGNGLHALDEDLKEIDALIKRFDKSDRG